MALRVSVRRRVQEVRHFVGIGFYIEEVGEFPGLFVGDEFIGAFADHTPRAHFGEDGAVHGFGVSKGLGGEAVAFAGRLRGAAGPVETGGVKVDAGDEVL